MRLLPNLVRGSHCIRLPLCDRSAELLVQALLSDPPEDRARHCLAAVSQDAALTLWCVCRAAGPDELRHMSDVASWLSTHAVSELRWTPAEIADAPTLGEAERTRYAELAAAAVGIARLASALASQHAPLDAQAAFLLGLVHDAPRWLSCAGLAREASTKPIQSIDPATALEFLPDWLSSELAPLEHAESFDHVDSAASMVKQALDALSRKRRRKSPLQLDLEPIAAEREATHARWLDESCGAVPLPALVDKLARLDQLETEFQRTLEFEKVESLKELAYGAGHEINNPLANISARAQTLLMEEHDPERRRKLAAINTQAFRAHEMIADMMLFARPPQLKPQRIELSVLLKTLLDDWQEQAAAQDTSLELWDAAGVVVWADPAQLAVAIRAVCTNALEALVRGGRVEIALQSGGAAAVNGNHAAAGVQAGNVQIVVTDNGPGIPPEARRHLFDPFYSGREAGRGLGFGLSKCWRIVTDHGGRIDVDAPPGGGARFTLTLPQFVESAAPLAGTAR